MAAKPPKPPGSFLSKSNNNKNTTTSSTDNSKQNNDKQVQKQTNNSQNHNNNNYQINTNNGAPLNGPADCVLQPPPPPPPTPPLTASVEQLNNNNSDYNSTNDNNSINSLNVVDTSKKPLTNCSCTNISIMHLFHEMKQKFPTIPDQIVAEHVNENCHQREKCIKELANELSLHPIPVQTYPGKTVSMRTKPATALKPTRIAPLRPTLLQFAANNSPNSTHSPAGSSTNSTPDLANTNTTGTQSPHMRLDGAEAIRTDVRSTINNYNNNTNNNNNNNHNLHSSHNNNNSSAQKSDMPILTKTTTTATTNSNNTTAHPNAKLSNDAAAAVSLSADSVPTPPPPPPQPPRVRPTTLNLQKHCLPARQKQPQRQKLVQQQLNERYQDMVKSQQQQQPARPVRKAPQPPLLPPKPSLLSQSANSGSINNLNSAHLQRLNQNHNQHTHHNNKHITLTQSQQSSFSNESSSSPSCLNSPAESEISVNVAVTSPTAHRGTSATPPIRHVSVISVQPEPPYTRDFLTTSPTSSVASTSSGKSFTSVNLTLRQPQANAAGGHLPATIDISAGPVSSDMSSGLGSGLTYSSTSYDSRRGLKKNFHISVSEQGSVVSASSLRPTRAREAFNRGGCNDQLLNDGNGNGEDDDDEFAKHNGVLIKNTNALSNGDNEHEREQPKHAVEQSSLLQLRYSQLRQQDEQAEQFQLKQRIIEQQRQQLQQQQSQQFSKQTTSVPATSTSYTNDAMCCKTEADDVTEKIEKQKQCRDCLAKQLRKKKSNLTNLHQEINLLTEPVIDGQLEELDIEIAKLRSECQALSAQISAMPPTTIGPAAAAAAAPQTATASSPARTPASPTQTPPQQQPQPFPRQRPSRSAAAATGTNSLPRQQQTSQDFVQHHSRSNSATSSTTSPRSPLTAVQLQQQQLLLQQQLQAQQQLLLSQQQRYLEQHQQQTRASNEDIYRNDMLSRAASSNGISDTPQQQQQHQQQQLINGYIDTDTEDDDVDADDIVNDATDDEEILEPWACNLCTFRNHPQLNICECCDNVRVLPGTIRIIPTATATPAAATPAAATATLS